MTDDTLIAKPASTTLRVAVISLILFVPLALVLWLLLKSYDQKLEAQYLDAQQVVLQSRLQSLNSELDRSLLQLRNLPQVVAESRNVQDALSRPESRYLWQDKVDHYLETVAGNLGVDQLWLMDTEGNALASSNYHSPDSLVGKNFAFRQYFKSAMNGDNGQQFGVGSSTLVPGFYFASPVQENGVTVGVVALEIDVASLVNWVRLDNVLVTDPDGLIVMASDSDYLLNTMPDSSLQTMSKEEMEKRYERPAFNALKLSLSGIYAGHNLWTLGSNDVPAMVVRQSSHPNGYEGVVYTYLTELDVLQTRHKVHLLIAFIASLLLAIAIATTIVYLRRSRESERALKANHAKLEMMNAQLESMAGEDPLTGLFNRRKLNALLDDEWARSKRYRRPLSLAVLDLDFFKRVNDTLGHGAGDAVLVHVAKLLSGNKRSSDILARMGGEEFLMVLPETRMPEASMLMERLRQLIEMSPTPWEGQSINLTVSIGISNLQAEDRVSDVLARADKALYEAKETGRNKLVALDRECISDGSVI